MVKILVFSLAILSLAFLSHSSIGTQKPITTFEAEVLPAIPVTLGVMPNYSSELACFFSSSLILFLPGLLSTCFSFMYTFTGGLRGGLWRYLRKRGARRFYFPGWVLISPMLWSAMTVSVCAMPVVQDSSTEPIEVTYVPHLLLACIVATVVVLGMAFPPGA